MSIYSEFMDVFDFQSAKERIDKAIAVYPPPINMV